MNEVYNPVRKATGKIILICCFLLTLPIAWKIVELEAVQGALFSGYSLMLGCYWIALFLVWAIFDSFHDTNFPKLD